MTWNGWRVLVLCLVASMASGGAAILYTNASARQSEQQWCEVLTTLDDIYREIPPRTPQERKLAAAIHQQRAGFGCPPGR
ncbi:hypothetical protein [Micromonospora sp. WMMD1274]|uniref:hypothetical protein n=1 Tax=Micromonospora sp. WMMD1274 TaxID=3404116 RepID=UPI003B962123